MLSAFQHARTPSSPNRLTRTEPQSTSAIFSKSRTGDSDSRSVRSLPLPSQVTPETPHSQSPPRSVSRPASTHSTHTPLVTTVTSPQNSTSGDDLDFHSTGSTTSRGSSISHALNSTRTSRTSQSGTIMLPRPNMSDVPHFRK